MVNNKERVSMARRTKEKVGLLDADIIAYQISAVNEVRVDWDNDGDISQYPNELKETTEQVDKHIGELMSQLKLDRVIICLTDKDNFRKEILSTYKANRAGALKPVMLASLKEYMANNYESYTRPKLEADDVMGILATHPTLIPGSKCIVSIDKDMKQIPTYVFNPDKDLTPKLIREKEANRLHYIQTLTGDAVDGYTGIPGVGPKKAETILNGHDGSEWDRIVKAYEQRGLTEADALVQAQVARICRAEDYNFDKAEVIPWMPK